MLSDLETAKSKKKKKSHFSAHKTPSKHVCTIPRVFILQSGENCECERHRLLLEPWHLDHCQQCCHYAWLSHSIYGLHQRKLSYYYVKLYCSPQFLIRVFTNAFTNAFTKDEHIVYKLWIKSADRAIGRISDYLCLALYGKKIPSEMEVRLILRCWGKSSMVCQQKSDAL